MKLIFQSKTKLGELFSVIINTCLISSPSKSVEPSFIVRKRHIFQDRHGRTGSHRWILVHASDLLVSLVFFYLCDIFSIDQDLSGFYRNDRILPVITLVLYFGTAPWDGPRSLKEMMRWTGEETEKYIQDYRLNLIIPTEMEDEEIEKLQSSLREVFYFLKYAGDWKKLEKILTDDERFQRLETEAATVIRELTNTEIEIKEEQEEQNMCKAIEQMKENERKIGLEDGKRIGRELGEAEIILRMYQKGYGSGQIAEMTDMEEERVKAIICMKLEIK